MPELHNQLFRGIWSDAIKRLFGVTKSPGGIERFGETLTPNVNLWGPELPEAAYLRKDTLFWMQLFQPAVPAEFAFVGLTLPTNSNALAVVERANVRGAVALTANAGICARSVIAATGTLGTAGVSRDTRYQDRPDVTPVRTVAQIESWTGSDPGNTLGGNVEEASTTGLLYSNYTAPPIILKPGSGFYIIAQTVNVLIVANIIGRVRAALPGELV